VCCAVLCCAVLGQVMWSIGVTALLVSSVVLTALIAYMDHFGESFHCGLPLDDRQESFGQALPTARTT
jgi:hypothetical protein